MNAAAPATTRTPWLETHRVGEGLQSAETAMMVLFGGGDGGGIYIDANGRLHRIPPWTPEVMSQLKVVNVLTTAAQRLGSADVGREMHAFAERLTGAVIPQVVRSVGGMAAGENTIAFLDGDDGFTCGTTGKHPIPFPIPHGSLGGRPTLAGMMEAVATPRVTA